MPALPIFELMRKLADARQAFYWLTSEQKKRMGFLAKYVLGIMVQSYKPAARYSSNNIGPGRALPRSAHDQPVRFNPAGAEGVQHDGARYRLPFGCIRRPSGHRQSSMRSLLRAGASAFDGSNVGFSTLLRML